MIKKLLIGAASALVTITGAQAATVFTENFDTPDIAPQWFVYDTFGAFVTVDGRGIEIQSNNTVGSIIASSGNQYVELDSDTTNGGGSSGSTNTAMGALVNLVAGNSYTVNFDFQPRTGNANDNGISVWTGTLDTVTRSFTNATQIGSADGQRTAGTDWALQSFTFTAGALDNAILFRAFGTANELGGFIDSVFVTTPGDVDPVPVPAAALLMAPALLLLRRKKK